MITRVFVHVWRINTVKRSLRVGKGIGPRTCAPVRLAVPDLRGRLIDQTVIEALKRIRILWFCIGPELNKI